MCDKVMLLTMTSNVVDISVSRRSREQFAPSVITRDGELTAIETLELVRTFSLIKDPSRRQTALDYLKQVGTETTKD